MTATEPTVTVEHVVAQHRIASVRVTLDDGPHRVGHHPSYPGGWRCLRCDSRTCPAVTHARDVVISLD